RYNFTMGQVPHSWSLGTRKGKQPMKKKNIPFLGAVSRLIPLFTLLASILILPKVQAEIGGMFTVGGLTYTIQTEEPDTKTGTVSVQTESLEISGNIAIPASIVNGGINYSVTLLPVEAFSSCSKLTSINIPNGITEIAEKTFYGCTIMTNVNIPEGVTSIGPRAFSGCNKLTSIEIPDSVVSIGKSAFSGCWSLTNVVIPESVTSIGPRAFTGCLSLTNIEFPESMTYIPDNLFDGCNSLTNITISENVTYIGEYAFYDCSSLTNITIPGSVTSIGTQAFYDCSSLTNITIPESVTSIGARAFSSCSSLTAVYFRGNAPVLPFGNAFDAPSVIYYKGGTTGWTNPWSGRPTALWILAPEIAEQPQS
ncbi:MAG: leucine-rich repeat domain-containing protein, partial [Bacteroidia bacterium]|nr:leucine-rich repeat domain-containing protein [Bacteroidia bacterium]